MLINFYNAALELAKVERVFFCGDILLVPGHQWEYTSRRILAFLKGEEAPTE